MPQFSSMFLRVSKGWQKMCPKSCRGWKLVSEGSKEEEQSFNNSEGLRGMQENGRVVCFHPNMKDPVICNTSQLKYIYIHIYISKVSCLWNAWGEDGFTMSGEKSEPLPTIRRMHKRARKAGWEHHFHSYLSKHKSRLLQSHTPCCPEHFLH